MKTDKLSPTIQSVLYELSKSKAVASWEIVKAILTRHHEYGEGRAREVASGPDPAPGDIRQAQDWINEVESLFDPVLVPSLHGRLVILGLCRLDETLARHLRGFRAALEQELFEDFESLLLPIHAGPAKYKHEFLVTLQNRGKLSKGAGPVRKGGFVFVATQGPGLKTLEQLCFRQRYNYCFTARYVLSSGSTADDLLQMLVADLRGLARSDTDTAGILLPEGTPMPGIPDPATWIQLAKESVHTLDSSVDNMPAAEILGKLFSIWQNVLNTGKRIVLFVEWRGVSKNATVEELELEEVFRQLSLLPERVGVVLSGLPAGVTSGLPGQILELPPDLALTRGLPLANDVPEGPDRLNIIGEVRALAEAIALKDMRPPVVVGVLGGWGSGKSFVLHLLEERLHEIRCEQIDPENDEAFPFIGHPYVVHFDAWTFAKSDLWASLMQTILGELDRQLTLEHTLAEDLGLDLRQSTEIWRLLGHLTDTQRKRLLKTELGKEALEKVAALQKKGTSGRLWEELHKLHKAANDDLAKQEDELLELQKKISTERLKFENAIDDDIAADARRMAWDPVWEQVLALVQGKFAKDDAPSYEEVVAAISLPKKFLLGVKEISLPAAFFALVALGGGIALGTLEPISEWISTSAGALIAAMAPLANAHTWLQKSRKSYDERLAQAEKTKGVSREQRIDEALTNALPGTVAAQVVNLEQQAQAKEAEVCRLKERVGISRHANLGEFIKERLESGFYEQRLGLLHQIQGDIEKLSETLLPSRTQGTVDPQELAKLFPRGMPRLILLIDDLDRCPPDKVVEVFEAAQLLIKTQLFVVVIAMDVRYITRALEDEYDGVLVRNGEPSGLDYIEKIIQIPYRVRTATASAIRGFLHHQMGLEDTRSLETSAKPETEPVEEQQGETGKEGVNEGRGPGISAVRTELRVLPTDVLQFQPTEHTVISACCGAVDVSPRAMKRLVNVFKLLKIIWYRQGLEDGPEPDVKQAMLSLLVLAARYPEAVRQLLAAMEAAFRGRQSPGGTALADFLVVECSRRAKTAQYPPEWEAVRTALQDDQFFPKSLTFSELDETNLHLVNSFSFVGETDSEREAALKHGYYRRADGQTGTGTRRDDDAATLSDADVNES